MTPWLQKNNGFIHVFHLPSQSKSLTATCSFKSGWCDDWLGHPHYPDHQFFRLLLPAVRGGVKSVLCIFDYLRRRPFSFFGSGVCCKFCSVWVADLCGGWWLLVMEVFFAPKGSEKGSDSKGVWWMADFMMAEGGGLRGGSPAVVLLFSRWWLLFVVMVWYCGSALEGVFGDVLVFTFAFWRW
ncbi:hypothetical protein QL285_090428 [Trifolium repens]|nr:hypothetical protein QL285_090428 [Trifolium repens]